MSEIKTLAEMAAFLESLKVSEYPGYSSGTWTPTFTGFTLGSEPVMVCRWVIVGKLCHCFARNSTSGTSNATGFTISAPFTAANVAGAQWGEACYFAVDNSVATANAAVSIDPNTNVFNLLKNASFTGWTAGLLKGASFKIIYELP